MTTARFPGRRRLAAAALTFALAPLTTAGAAPVETAAQVAPERVNERQVLAISVDGLNVRALRVLGRAQLPHLFRLLREGASTRNARSQVEMTVTLPNHTSMITGRRIDAAEGGHGVTWNRDRARTTVQEAAGDEVDSIFTRVHAAGGRTALFATESKFSLFNRSWPQALHRSTIVQDGDGRVTRAVRRDLLRRDRAFTLLHLGAPDEAGHDHGWLSPAYLDAVKRVDAHLGVLLRAVKRHPARLRDVVIVLTSDHGGKPGSTSHRDETCACNYRVPFLVWGRPVTRGNLYDLNPTYADPGRARILFDGTQPIRNGDVANLSASLLGITAVPSSLWGADQTLTWRRGD